MQSLKIATNLGVAAALAIATLLSPLVITSASAAIPWPREMVINYCWGSSEYSDLCPTQDLTLNKRPKTLTVGSGTNVLDTGTWSWNKPTKEITLNFDNNSNIEYVGKKFIKRDGGNKFVCFDGTMENSTTGMTGVWQGCYTTPK